MNAFERERAQSRAEELQLAFVMRGLWGMADLMDRCAAVFGVRA